MSGKRPKGTFQEHYNKPDSTIPPDSEDGILKGFVNFSITLFFSSFE